MWGNGGKCKSRRFPGAYPPALEMVTILWQNKAVLKQEEPGVDRMQLKQLEMGVVVKAEKVELTLEQCRCWGANNPCS